MKTGAGKAVLILWVHMKLYSWCSVKTIDILETQTALVTFVYNITGHDTCTSQCRQSGPFWLNTVIPMSVLFLKSFWFTIRNLLCSVHQSFYLNGLQHSNCVYLFCVCVCVSRWCVLFFPNSTVQCSLQVLLCSVSHPLTGLRWCLLVHCTSKLSFSQSKCCNIWTCLWTVLSCPRPILKHFICMICNKNENTDANFSLKSDILQTVRTFLNAIWRLLIQVF
jgi:hypothetical protein